METNNETVEQVCKEMTGWEHHTWMCASDHEYLNELADRILAAHNREIAELNRKIMDYERQLSKFPCGVIYQLGILDQDGNMLNGVTVMFDSEAEAAKMPRVGHGDRFYIIPMVQAKIVKGVVE